MEGHPLVDDPKSFSRCEVGPRCVLPFTSDPFQTCFRAGRPNSENGSLQEPASSIRKPQHADSAHSLWASKSFWLLTSSHSLFHRFPKFHQLASSSHLAFASESTHILARHLGSFGNFAPVAVARPSVSPNSFVRTFRILSVPFDSDLCARFNCLFDCICVAQCDAPSASGYA